MSDIDNTREDDVPLEAPVADTAEPMRLRGTPPRVTRLSRRVLAGLGLVGALGVGGALIYALQTPESGTGGDELYSTENRNTADGLNELPSDYTGPVLGPPLPGDLGRPILDAQERGQPVPPPPINAPAVDPEEQRRLAEEEAARTSRVFFQTAPSAAQETSPPNLAAACSALSNTKLEVGKIGSECSPSGVLTCPARTARVAKPLSLRSVMTTLK